MANKILSALNQAMNMVDTKVRDPLVNMGVQAMRGVQKIGGNIRSAQDEAYKAYWAKHPQELLSPLGRVDPFAPGGDYEQLPNGAYRRKNTQNQVTVGTQGINPNGPPVNIKNSPVNPNDLVNTFKFIMGQNKYPDAKRQLETMYKAKGNPPMAQYTDQFVAMGEKYKVDPRILATIAQIESSGGRNYPTQSNNPFGYLGGTGNTVAERLNAGFTSVPHAIEALSRRFSTRYPDFIKNPTPSQLQTSYNATPSERQRYIDLMTEILPYMQ